MTAKAACFSCTQVFIPSRIPLSLREELKGFFFNRKFYQISEMSVSILPFPLNRGFSRVLVKEHVALTLGRHVHRAKKGGT